MASVLSTTSLCNNPSTNPPSPTHRGRYESLAGTTVYVTGSPSSRKAIIDVNDAFNLSPSSTISSLEAADELASSLNAMVIVPDLSPRVPKDVAQLGDFLSEVRGDLSKNFEFMSEASAEAQQMWPEVEAWGVCGLSGERDDVQIFYNPLAVLLYIQLTVAAVAKKMEQ